MKNYFYMKNYLSMQAFENYQIDKSSSSYLLFRNKTGCNFEPVGAKFEQILFNMRYPFMTDLEFDDVNKKGLEKDIHYFFYNYLPMLSLAELY
jgi:hypothetical protein